jgi:hypothetical protein
MYRSGHDLFQGWAKNVATGARRTPVLRAIGVAIWVSALISMLISVVTAPGSELGWVTGAVLYAAAALQVEVLGSKVGRFGLAAAFWPVLLACFLVIFACSTAQTAVLRRAWWSGRSVPLHRVG